MERGVCSQAASRLPSHSPLPPSLPPSSPRNCSSSELHPGPQGLTVSDQWVSNGLFLQGPGETQSAVSAPPSHWHGSQVQVAIEVTTTLDRVNISFLRTPGESDKHYVSVVSNDDFQAFQQNGYHDDEDIDFSPQNGYYDQEEEEEPRTVVNSKAKWVSTHLWEWGPREFEELYKIFSKSLIFLILKLLTLEWPPKMKQFCLGKFQPFYTFSFAQLYSPTQLFLCLKPAWPTWDLTVVFRKTGAPKVDLMGKIAAAGSAIKNAKLPSPGELKEGYLNSAFHKSLHQPLMVKAKVEKTDVQKARQALTQVC